MDRSAETQQPTQFSLADAQLRKGDVLVLGAGFSRALTDKAPTMKGFLVASAAEGALAPEYVDLGRALNQFFGLKLEDINIEELATFLVDEFRLDRSYHPHAAYDELIRVITATLSKAWEGAKESASLHLARAMANRCLEEHVPVVTLNYDLIIDNLLHETGKWNPDFGYGVHLEAPFHEQFDFMERQVPGSPLPLMNLETILLKLHGSLNWGIRSSPHPDGTAKVEVVSVDKFENLTIRQGTKAEWPPIARQIVPLEWYGLPYPGEPRIRYRPLIVPPYSQKTASQYPLIAHTWHLTREILSNAHRIIVAGYSLPPADYKIRDLLREAIGTLSEHRQQREHPVTVLVINRCSEVASRFRELFASFSKVKVLDPYTECVDWMRDAAGSDPAAKASTIVYPTGGLDLTKPVYSRSDGSYVVTFNDMPYHVLTHEQARATGTRHDALYDEVAAYVAAHPEAVQPENTANAL